MLATLRQTVEYLGGEIDEPPVFLTGKLDLVARCLFVALAVVLIYAFSGQSSKFIYIDF